MGWDGFGHGMGWVKAWDGVGRGRGGDRGGGTGMSRNEEMDCVYYMYSL